jgi:hypothetical protein
MRSIELTPEQKPTYDQLMTMVEAIEKRLRLEIDPSNSEEITYEINHRQRMNADSGKILEYATLIYNNIKGVVGEEAMSREDVLTSKAAFQKLWVEGRLARWTAMYARCEEATKTLDKSISGLISMLSYNKELIKSQVGSSNWSGQ